MQFFGRVTGIGSLPHLEPGPALAFVARHCPEIPFWPQLPRRDAREHMVAQALGTGDSVALVAAEAAGFLAFDAAIEDGVFPRALLLKGQLAGPVTVSRSETAVGPDAAARAIGPRAGWQARRLARHGKPVLIVVDEPALGVSLGSGDLAPDAIAAAVRMCFDAIRAEGAIAGLHCCSRPPAGLVAELDPDVLSFDADRGLEVLLAEPPMQSWLARGRSLALGIVPTDRPADSTAMLARVAALSRDVFERCLITAACGFGLRTVEEADAAFAACTTLSAALQRRFAERAPRGPATGTGDTP